MAQKRWTFWLFLLVGGLCLATPTAVQASIMGEENVPLWAIWRQLLQLSWKLQLHGQQMMALARDTAQSSARVALHAPAATRRHSDATSGLWAAPGTFDLGALGQDHDAVLVQLDRQRLYARATGQGLLRGLGGRGLTAWELQAYQARSAALSAAANLHAATVLEKTHAWQEQAHKKRLAAAHEVRQERTQEVAHMGLLPATQKGVGQGGRAPRRAGEVHHGRR